MLIRRHQQGDTLSEAVYSDCSAYRYRLSRHWGDGPGLLFVMLNPSTADELRNDPTVERCERRARALGVPGFCVMNLFAFRSTDPRGLRLPADPVGPENDALLQEAARQADTVLCAWGNHGAYLNRAAQVTAVLQTTGKPLFHLGLTKAGHPTHPLYRPFAQAPQRWDQAANSRMS